MESEISFLGNPKLDLANLPYIENKKEVYANLYEIKIKKELKFCQYPYSVTPEIEAGDFRIRNKLFKACYKELKETYGECFVNVYCNFYLCTFIFLLLDVPCFILRI